MSGTADTEQEVSKLVVKETQCPYCSVQCKMSVEEMAAPVAGQRRAEYAVQGLPNKASQGRLCVKGLNAHQQVFSSERLMQPLIRCGGELQPCSWEEALQTIADRVQQLQHTYGPDTVGVYGGGSLTNETAYLLGKFARVALGTKYIDYNGRFCMSAAASAGYKVFGIDRGLTFPLSDIPKAECIILAGTNIAECQPTLLPYFNEAKENGALIIVIDPRKTATAAIADLHLQVKPGMDALLADAMLKVILEAGLVDSAFVKQRTSGYEQLVQEMESLQLEHAATACGVEPDMIRKAAIAYGSAKTGMIMTARGVEQQTDGHMAVRHFLNLVLATGKIGRTGCGYGAVTGQGNGQGGREHGQKADQLPGYRSIENAEDRAYIASVWGVEPEALPGKGVSAYEMMERIHEQHIRALLVMGSNPVVSNPNVRLVEEGLRKLDLLVVADIFLSETARMADIVLPVTAYMENEGTLTNLEGRVLLREQVRTAPGETLDDWVILCQIATKLGKGSGFEFDKAEDIFNELRVASRGGKADYYGITYERLRKEQGVYWPCPSAEHQGEGLLFRERFAHTDGKAEFTLGSSPGWDDVSDEYPLILTNGRILPHYLTGVQTRRSPALSARELENFVELHPATAARHRIRDGEWVEITSAYGTFTVRSRIRESIRNDTLFVPMHWGGIQNVNRATRPELDPVCRMPGFKTAAVRIQPLRLV
ncbi:assimilatory nitrate reductase catalytic subunit NasC [Paenibacillus silvae]|uniref:assimilatory nitrate reductase catalytic subunit NasC n=1 Tax=Paenibacillus silvae TaxID=1325358 RepID=UPI0025A25CB1|nr:molybdopterin oxidoreductase family protein [Paenibacillus silvae]MDM5279757.1 molybdopterin oxidoreductase family protein [Paenibacillus silvae]